MILVEKEVLVGFDIIKAEKEAAKCFDNCSDYSCVRSGYCTGPLGNAVTNFYIKQREEQREKAEYARMKYLEKKYG